MTAYLRIFASEDGARRADAALAADGYPDRVLLLPSTTHGQERSAVDSAIRAGNLPERCVLLCVRSLKEGRSIVGVEAPWGSGVDAIDIMEREDTVYTDVIKGYISSDPSPLSDMLKISTLASFVPSAGLLDSNWSFSSKFGMGLLSQKAAPLSSMFGMATLTKPKRNWTSSFGIPMLSNNAAPLSSMFGMATLTKPKKEWKSSFGFPLLSDNPAPLSTLLGLSVLTKDR